MYNNYNVHNELNCRRFWNLRSIYAVMIQFDENSSGTQSKIMNPESMYHVSVTKFKTKFTKLDFVCNCK